MNVPRRKAAPTAAGVCVLLVVFLAAASWGAVPSGKVSSEEAAVQKTVDALVETLNTADIDAFSALFAPDATVFFPLAPVLGLLDGKAEIAKVFKIFFESVRKDGGGPRYMELKPEGLKIQLYGDTALVTFHFTGRTMYSRRTLVLRHEAGKWMIVHMHASGLPIQER